MHLWCEVVGEHFEKFLCKICVVEGIINCENCEEWEICNTSIGSRSLSIDREGRGYLDFKNEQRKVAQSGHT